MSGEKIGETLTPIRALRLVGDQTTADRIQPTQPMLIPSLANSHLGNHSHHLSSNGLAP